MVSYNEAVKPAEVAYHRAMIDFVSKDVDTIWGDAHEKAQKIAEAVFNEAYHGTKTGANLCRSLES